MARKSYKPVENDPIVESEDPEISEVEPSTQDVEPEPDPVYQPSTTVEELEPEPVEHLPPVDITDPTPPVFVQKRKGRVAGSKNKAKATPIEVKDIPALDLRLFADMLDSIAVSVLGDGAGMTVLEKTLFYTGIEHYSKTVGAETVQKISANATPFFLLMGVGVWGLRLWTMYGEKKKKEKEIAITSIPNTPVDPRMNMGVGPDFFFNNVNRN